MKYFVQGWGHGGAGTTSFTVGSDPKGHQGFDTYSPHVVAQFPVHPRGDVERRERALMLANKVRDFLNELEEKKAQVAELMNIAGQ